MLGEKWTDAIETTIRRLSGLHSPVISPDSLLLAASSVLEKLKRAEGGGKWIAGLPTEPGYYWYAASLSSVDDWHVGHGEMIGPGNHSLGLGSTMTTAWGYDWQHQPAPPLPEAP